MKKFKIIDVWVSAILIIGSLIYAAIVQNETFIVAYFVVGAWQIMSMVVHADKDWFNEKGSGRKIYHRTVLIIIISTILSLFLKIIIIVLIILLFAAPFMALFYAYMCYDETYIKMKRPLDDLK